MRACSLAGTSAFSHWMAFRSPDQYLSVLSSALGRKSCTPRLQKCILSSLCVSFRLILLVTRLTISRSMLASELMLSMWRPAQNWQQMNFGLLGVRRKGKRVPTLGLLFLRLTQVRAFFSVWPSPYKYLFAPIEAMLWLEGKRALELGAEIRGSRTT